MPSLLYSPAQCRRSCRRAGCRFCRRPGCRPRALLLAPGLLLAILLLPQGPARAQLGLLKPLGALFQRPAPAPPAGPSAPALPGSTPEPVFQDLLRTGDLQALDQACKEAVTFDFVTRLRLLRQRLMLVAPAPQPLSVVLRNADVLLSCRAPDGALSVLDRYSPGPGPDRDRWLLTRWRAAQAGLQHRLAAESLERLAGGRIASLESVALPLRQREDGSLVTRGALDVYAELLEVLGRRQEAAAALLAGQLPGRPAAERLQRAVALLDGLPLEQREALLERALDQAAAGEAWGLALSLLEDQRRLIEQSGGRAERARARLSVLSQRVDDAHSEWQLRRQDPQQSARAAQLQQQLRSPRSPGGHATSQP